MNIQSLKQHVIFTIRHNKHLFIQFMYHTINKQNFLVPRVFSQSTYNFHLRDFRVFQIDGNPGKWYHQDHFTITQQRKLTQVYISLSWNTQNGKKNRVATQVVVFKISIFQVSESLERFRIPISCLIIS